MKMRSLPILATALGFASGVFISTTASAGTARALVTHGSVEILIRERSGTKFEVVKRKRVDSPHNAATSASYKNGTMTVSARSKFAFDLTKNIPDIKFRCQAKGENTQDSTAPSGHSSDSVTAFSTAKLSESIIVEGFRFGAFTLDRAKFSFQLRIHGKVSKSGDNTVASGRAQLTSHLDGTPDQIYTSEDVSSPFDSGALFTESGDLSGLRSPTNFSLDVLSVACIAKYKQCSINADVFDTVTMSAFTLTDKDGKRFEAPELSSASGFDYTRILNVPTPGTGTGEFAFASDILSTGEGDGTLVVRVNRDGGSTGIASVVVRNTTVPAAGEDFEPFSTTLNFADGETQKNVLVKLFDDFTQQGTRTFDLELASASGATLSATRATLHVTLDDDDTAYSPSAISGTYAARINPGGPAADAGLITLTITPKSACTFSGILRGRKFNSRSTLNQLDLLGGGGQQVNIPGIGKVNITILTMDTAGGIPSLKGSVTFPDTSTAEIRGTKLYVIRDAIPPTSKRGTYTLNLDPGPGAPPASPLGSGFARVNVSTSGKVTLIGKLADGTPLSTGGTLSVSRELSLLLPIAKTKGQLSGTLRFRSIPGVSDIDGTLQWLRPASTKPGLFATGFTTTLVTIGAHFDAPDAESLILPGLAATTGHALFTATSPDLATQLQSEVTIAAAPKNTVTPLLPNAEKIKITLIPKTGFLSGSFLSDGKTVKFQGALLQLGSLAGGYFLGPTQSGRITLAPGTLTP